jgi:hypothetical protein
MSYEIQNLKPIHSVVARELALGIPLRDICKSRNLVYESWTQITTSSLFRSEIARIQREIENDVIDHHVNDPVRLRLQNAGIAAADRMISEIDNFDDGKAATRISAAVSTLEILGYKKQEQKNVIVLNLSAAKLDTITGLGDLTPQPETIKG